MTTLVQCARQRSRRICVSLGLALCLALVLSPSGQVRTRAQEPGPDAAGAKLKDAARERGPDRAPALIAVPGGMNGLRGPRVTSSAQLGAASTAASVAEAEPNDTPGAATPLGVTPVRVRATLFRSPFSAGVDVDLYSFTAGAGDRVYAATITAGTAGSTNTVLDILASDGTTVLETDDEDGAASESASNIAGLVVPTTGTYYVRVRQFTTDFSHRHNPSVRPLRPRPLWCACRRDRTQPPRCPAAARAGRLDERRDRFRER